MPAPRLIIPKEKLVELIDKNYNKKEMMKELNIAKKTLDKLLNENYLSIKEKPDETIGKTFGKLTVLERLENSKDRRKVYKCLCECGNETIVKSKYLYNGDTKSCGCYEKDFSDYQHKNYKQALKRVGEKHGKLTIIDVVMIDGKGKYAMVCKCECKSISTKIYSQISKGEIVSCGCYARECSSIRASTILMESRYSSNKTKWYFIKNSKKIFCRSGYEVIFANHLIINNIEFEYEPKTFKLGNGKRYTPDFYLIDEDRYVELKGVHFNVIDRNNQKGRIDIFRQSYKLDIYYWEDLFEICDLPYKGYSNYKKNSDKLKMNVEDYFGKMIYLTY